MAVESTPIRDGGRRLSVTLTAEEYAALGGDAETLTDDIATVMWALAMLRTGRAGEAPASDDWALVIEHIDTRMLPRITGLRDAAIRAHAAADGSHGELAAAMGVSRSTAQSRRSVVVDRAPSGWEHWAADPRTP